jgi:hypothetical protein
VPLNVQGCKTHTLTYGPVALNAQERNALSELSVQQQDRDSDGLSHWMDIPLVDVDFMGLDAGGDSLSLGILDSNEGPITVWKRRRSN